MRDNNKENLNCSLEEGSIAAINAHMGNIAFRTGKKIYWDKEMVLKQVSMQLLLCKINSCFLKNYKFLY